MFNNGNGGWGAVVKADASRTSAESDQASCIMDGAMAHSAYLGAGTVITNGAANFKEKL